MKYPKSRLKLAVETAKAVRLIIDILADQAELAESLVNLCVQEAYDQMEICGLTEEKPSDKSPTQSDPHFGFDSQEVRVLFEDEED
jgi:hypothetical protein